MENSNTFLSRRQKKNRKKHEKKKKTTFLTSLSIKNGRESDVVQGNLNQETKETNVLQNIPETSFIQPLRGEKPAQGLWSEEIEEDWQDTEHRVWPLDDLNSNLLETQVGLEDPILNLTPISKKTMIENFQDAELKAEWYRDEESFVSMTSGAGTKLKSNASIDKGNNLFQKLVEKNPNSLLKGNKPQIAYEDLKGTGTIETSGTMEQLLELNRFKAKLNSLKKSEAPLNLSVRQIKRNPFHVKTDEILELDQYHSMITQCYVYLIGLLELTKTDLTAPDMSKLVAEIQEIRHEILLAWVGLSFGGFGIEMETLTKLLEFEMITEEDYDCVVSGRPPVTAFCLTIVEKGLQFKSPDIFIKLDTEEEEQVSYLVGDVSVGQGVVMQAQNKASKYLPLVQVLNEFGYLTNYHHWHFDLNKGVFLTNAEYQYTIIDFNPQPLYMCQFVQNALVGSLNSDEKVRLHLDNLHSYREIKSWVKKKDGHEYKKMSIETLKKIGFKNEDIEEIKYLIDHYSNPDKKSLNYLEKNQAILNYYSAEARKVVNKIGYSETGDSKYVLSKNSVEVLQDAVTQNYKDSEKRFSLLENPKPFIYYMAPWSFKSGQYLLDIYNKVFDQPHLVETKFKRLAYWSILIQSMDNCLFEGSILSQNSNRFEREKVKTFLENVFVYNKLKEGEYTAFRKGEIGIGKQGIIYNLGEEEIYQVCKTSERIKLKSSDEYKFLKFKAGVGKKALELAKLEEMEAGKFVDRVESLPFWEGNCVEDCVREWESVMNFSTKENRLTTAKSCANMYKNIIAATGSSSSGIRIIQSDNPQSFAIVMPNRSLLEQSKDVAFYFVGVVNDVPCKESVIGLDLCWFSWKVKCYGCFIMISRPIRLDARRLHALSTCFEKYHLSSMCLEFLIYEKEILKKEMTIGSESPRELIKDSSLEEELTRAEKYLFSICLCPRSAFQGLLDNARYMLENLMGTHSGMKEYVEEKFTVPTKNTFSVVLHKSIIDCLYETCKATQNIRRGKVVMEASGYREDLKVDLRCDYTGVTGAVYKHPMSLIQEVVTMFFCIDKGLHAPLQNKITTHLNPLLIRQKQISEHSSRTPVDDLIMDGNYEIGRSEYSKHVMVYTSLLAYADSGGGYERRNIVTAQEKFNDCPLEIPTMSSTRSILVRQPINKESLKKNTKGNKDLSNRELQVLTSLNDKMTNLKPGERIKHFNSQKKKNSFLQKYCVDHKKGKIVLRQVKLLKFVDQIPELKDRFYYVSTTVLNETLKQMIEYLSQETDFDPNNPVKWTEKDVDKMLTMLEFIKEQVGNGKKEVITAIRQKLQRTWKDREIFVSSMVIKTMIYFIEHYFKWNCKGLESEKISESGDKKMAQMLSQKHSLYIHMSNYSKLVESQAFKESTTPMVEKIHNKTEDKDFQHAGTSTSSTESGSVLNFEKGGKDGQTQHYELSSRENTFQSNEETQAGALKGGVLGEKTRKRFPQQKHSTEKQDKKLYAKDNEFEKVYLPIGATRKKEWESLKRESELIYRREEQLADFDPLEAINKQEMMHEGILTKSLILKNALQEFQNSKKMTNKGLSQGIAKETQETTLQKQGNINKDLQAQSESESDYDSDNSGSSGITKTYMEEIAHAKAWKDEKYIDERVKAFESYRDFKKQNKKREHQLEEEFLDLTENVPALFKQEKSSIVKTVKQKTSITHRLKEFVTNALSSFGNKSHAVSGKYKADKVPITERFEQRSYEVETDFLNEEDVEIGLLAYADSVSERSTSSTSTKELSERSRNSLPSIVTSKSSKGGQSLNGSSERGLVSKKTRVSKVQWKDDLKISKTENNGDNSSTSEGEDDSSSVEEILEVPESIKETSESKETSQLSEKEFKVRMCDINSDMTQWAPGDNIYKMIYVVAVDPITTWQEKWTFIFYLLTLGTEKQLYLDPQVIAHCRTNWDRVSRSRNLPEDKTGGVFYDATKGWQTLRVDLDYTWLMGHLNYLSSFIHTGLMLFLEELLREKTNIMHMVHQEHSDDSQISIVMITNETYDEMIQRIWTLFQAVTRPGCLRTSDKKFNVGLWMRQFISIYEWVGELRYPWVKAVLASVSGLPYTSINDDISSALSKLQDAGCKGAPPFIIKKASKVLIHEIQNLYGLKKRKAEVSAEKGLLSAELNLFTKETKVEENDLPISLGGIFDHDISGFLVGGPASLDGAKLEKVFRNYDKIPEDILKLRYEHSIDYYEQKCLMLTKEMQSTLPSKQSLKKGRHKTVLPILEASQKKINYYKSRILYLQAQSKFEDAPMFYDLELDESDHLLGDGFSINCSNDILAYENRVLMLYVSCLERTEIDFSEESQNYKPTVNPLHFRRFGPSPKFKDSVFPQSLYTPEVMKKIEEYKVNRPSWCVMKPKNKLDLLLHYLILYNNTSFKYACSNVNQEHLHQQRVENKYKKSVRLKKKEGENQFGDDAPIKEDSSDEEEFDSESSFKTISEMARMFGSFVEENNLTSERIMNMFQVVYSSSPSAQLTHLLAQSSVVYGETITNQNKIPTLLKTIGKTINTSNPTGLLIQYTWDKENYDRDGRTALSPATIDEEKKILLANYDSGFKKAKDKAKYLLSLMKQINPHTTRRIFITKSSKDSPLENYLTLTGNVERFPFTARIFLNRQILFEGKRVTVNPAKKINDITLASRWWCCLMYCLGLLSSSHDEAMRCMDKLINVKCNGFTLTACYYESINKSKKRLDNLIRMLAPVYFYWKQGESGLNSLTRNRLNWMKVQTFVSSPFTVQMNAERCKLRAIGNNKRISKLTVQPYKQVVVDTCVGDLTTFLTKLASSLNTQVNTLLSCANADSFIQASTGTRIISIRYKKLRLLSEVSTGTNISTVPLLIGQSVDKTNTKFAWRMNTEDWSKVQGHQTWTNEDELIIDPEPSISVRMKNNTLNSTEGVVIEINQDDNLKVENTIFGEGMILKRLIDSNQITNIARDSILTLKKCVELYDNGNWYINSLRSILESFHVRTFHPGNQNSLANIFENEEIHDLYDFDTMEVKSDYGPGWIEISKRKYFFSVEEKRFELAGTERDIPDEGNMFPQIAGSYKLLIRDEDLANTGDNMEEHFHNFQGKNPTKPWEHEYKEENEFYTNEEIVAESFTQGPVFVEPFQTTGNKDLLIETLKSLKSRDWQKESLMIWACICCCYKTAKKAVTTSPFLFERLLSRPDMIEIAIHSFADSQQGRLMTLNDLETKCTTRDILKLISDCKHSLIRYMPSSKGRRLLLEKL